MSIIDKVIGLNCPILLDNLFVYMENIVQYCVIIYPFINLNKIIYAQSNYVS